MKTSKWKDLQVGHVFPCGSKLTQVHPIEEKHTFRITFGWFGEVVVSEDHLLLCDISKLDTKLKHRVYNLFEHVLIPSSANSRVFIELEEEKLSAELEEQLIKYVIKGEPLDIDIIKFQKLEDIHYEPAISHGQVWLRASDIAQLSQYGKIYCNKNKITSTYSGIRKVRCISTDSKTYKQNALIHHNSVTLRNIIFHVLTHNYQWGIGLVDLKLTEFSHFSDLNGVVTVANTLPEAAELFRVAREVMYRRNQILKEHKLQDIADYKPQHPTDKIYVSGRRLHEDTELDIKIDGEKKKITAKGLLELVNQF